MKCAGTVKATGLPCQRDVANGFTRCYVHGAATLSSKHAAEKALAFARMPAIEALHQMIEDWHGTACPTCGRPAQQVEILNPVIRACQIILDRTGFGPRATLEVAKPETAEFDVALLTDSERARLAAAISVVRSLKVEIRQRLAAAQAAEDQALPTVKLLTQGEDTPKGEGEPGGDIRKTA